MTALIVVFLLPPAEPSKDSRAFVSTALCIPAAEADIDQKQQITKGMLSALRQFTAPRSALGSWAPEGRELGQLQGSQEQELLSSWNQGSLPSRNIDVIIKRKLSKCHS